MLYWGTKQEWGKRGGQAGRPGEHLQGGALWSWQLAPYRIQEYSTGLIRKHLQRNHMEPLHLKTIHWEKEKEAIFLWVPSCVLSLISQNPSHGIVIPYDLHAGCIIGHFGKSSGKLRPPWVQSGQTWCWSCSGSYGSGCDRTCADAWSWTPGGGGGGQSWEIWWPELWPLKIGQVA